MTKSNILPKLNIRCRHNGFNCLCKAIQNNSAHTKCIARENNASSILLKIQCSFRNLSPELFINHWWVVGWSCIILIANVIILKSITLWGNVSHEPKNTTETGGDLTFAELCILTICGDFASGIFYKCIMNNLNYNYIIQTNAD